MKRDLIGLVLLAVSMEAAIMLPSTGIERVMHDGPKVAIKSTAMNIIGRQKNSNLHEIYLTPYRYVSASTCMLPSIFKLRLKKRRHVVTLIRHDVKFQGLLACIAKYLALIQKDNNHARYKFQINQVLNSININRITWFKQVQVCKSQSYDPHLIVQEC